MDTVQSKLQHTGHVLAYTAFITVFLQCVIRPMGNLIIGKRQPGFVAPRMPHTPLFEQSFGGRGAFKSNAVHRIKQRKLLLAAMVFQD
jgi:hypothetical protein